MSARGNRQIAIQAGKQYYFANKPCKYNHPLEPIPVSTGGHCRTCSRLKERERYYANPEKIKAKTNINAGPTIQL